MDFAQLPDEVVVHVASYHLDRSREFNEFNPGVGLRWHGQGGFLAAGFYRNSLYRTTAYAGVGKDFTIAGPFAFRVTAGLVTGYEIPVAPALVPELTFTGKRYGAAVGFMPKLEVGGKTVESVITFSILKRF